MAKICFSGIIICLSFLIAFLIAFLMHYPYLYPAGTAINGEDLLFWNYYLFIFPYCFPYCFYNALSLSVPCGYRHKWRRFAFLELLFVYLSLLLSLLLF